MIEYVLFLIFCGIIFGIIFLAVLGYKLLIKWVDKKIEKREERERQMIRRAQEFLWNKVCFQKETDWAKTIICIRYRDFFHVIQMYDGRYACCYGKDVGVGDPIRDFPQMGDEGFYCDENFVLAVIQYLESQNIYGVVEELERIYDKYEDTTILSGEINMVIEYHWKDIDLNFFDVVFFSLIITEKNSVKFQELYGIWKN